MYTKLRLECYQHCRVIYDNSKSLSVATNKAFNSYNVFHPILYRTLSLMLLTDVHETSTCSLYKKLAFKFLMHVSCTSVYFLYMFYFVKETCRTVQETYTRKILLQVAMTDMQVSCTSFLYMCHWHKHRNYYGAIGSFKMYVFSLQLKA